MSRVALDTNVLAYALLSEDFQHGFTWSGVTVLNPFVSPQHPLLAAAIAQA